LGLIYFLLRKLWSLAIISSSDGLFFLFLTPIDEKATFGGVFLVLEFVSVVMAIELTKVNTIDKSQYN
jgi:hypothetical protein